MMVDYTMSSRTPAPRWFPMTVVAQDPSVRVRPVAGGRRRILTARVRVPAD